MTEAQTELVRLHVSPLSPETYPIVIPSSLHRLVAGLSYHQIPTFPERDYAYLELPRADAEKLQRRLHGAIIKGVKVKIEAARPKTEYFTPEADASQEAREGGNLTEPLKGATRGSIGGSGADKVVRGAQLPDERRVRRGWTQPLVMKRDRKAAKGTEDAKKSRIKPVKSEYTDKEECLFKTKAKVKASAKDSGKKRKRGDDTIVVHEFENTTKFPSFLRGSGADGKRPTSGYDADKGWLDADGQAVEQPRRSKRLSQEVPREVVASISTKTRSKPAAKTSSMTRATKKLSLRNQRTSISGAADDTSSSGDSDSSDGDGEQNDKTASIIAKRLSLQSATEQSAAEGDNSGSDSDASGAKEAEPSRSVEEATTPKTKVNPAPSLKLSMEIAEESKDEVHPLEAIFKKPKVNSRKPPGLELKIPFSFFGGDDAGSSDDDAKEEDDKPKALPQMPQTPFTQADLRFRRERSAAPTPDTAAPTKLLFGPVLDRVPPRSDEREGTGEEGDGSNETGDGDADGRDEGDDGEDPTTGGTQPAGTAPASSSGRAKRSEFADKVFWENRGDNNRAWKKRRREAAKQTKQKQAASRRSTRDRREA